MTMPGSGPISLGQARTELGISGPISLGQSQTRTLAGVSSGAISMNNLYGKSNAGAPAPYVTISPASQDKNAPAGARSFDTVGAGANNGTASSYNWYFTGVSGFTATVNSGQGTSQAVPRFAGVSQGNTVTAYFWCDVVINGTTYSASCTLSFTNTSGGGNV